MEIANSGDLELLEVEWEFVGQPQNWHIMANALPAYPIPILAPSKHIRVPVVLTAGGPAYVDLTFRAKTDAGVTYEVTEQLSVYG